MNVNELCEKLFKDAAEDQIKASYNRYVDSYKSASLDYEDVCQEVRVHIFKVVGESKINDMDYNDQCKYIGMCVKNCLLTILRDTCKIDLPQGLVAFTTHPEKTDEQILKDLRLEMEDLNESQIEIMIAILEKKFIQSKTEAQIAKELDLTRNTVRGIYMKAFSHYAKHKNRRVKNERFSASWDMYGADKEVAAEEDIMLAWVNIGALDINSVATEQNNDTFFIMIKGHLTELEFDVIERTFKDKLDVREIATILSVSPATVSRAYTSAIAKLKRKLGNFGTDS